MATDKQIAANRENAKKGGVKSEEGKAVVRWNALRHGLLAQEAVIDAGEGKESREQFDSLLGELRGRLQPEGVMAVSYWRYRRAIRHEVGLIRSRLDEYESEYYDPDEHKFENDWKTHHKVQAEIDELKEYVEFFRDPDDKQGDYVNPQKVEEEGWEVDLEDYYKALLDVNEIPSQPSFITAEYNYDVQAMHTWLIGNGWTSEKIKAQFVKIAQDKIKAKTAELEKAKAEDQNHLSQTAKERSLPPADGADSLIRYESAILRHFYRAMHELERLQGALRGVAVPPPVTVDFEVGQSNP